MGLNGGKNIKYSQGLVSTGPGFDIQIGDTLHTASTDAYFDYLARSSKN